MDPALTKQPATGDRMIGFPPAPGSLVTVANWQEPANVRWAFRHMREFLPTQAIPAGEVGARPLPLTADSTLGAVEVDRMDHTTATFDDVISETWTDALLLLHQGTIVKEHYYAGMTARTPHLLQSISKSIVGCVAGILVHDGALRADAPVTTYVPEVAGSGYGDATVRHLLDMRSGVAFRETYDSPDAEVRIMERSMGWSPPLPSDPVGAYEYLTTLGTAEDHGGRFTYRSADTDMLGWVCERAGGARMADQVSSLLWQPLGAERDAEVTCDPVGSAIHDGGISSTARDLARFGQMLLDDGLVDGHEVVPRSWLVDGDPDQDVREAFARSDNESVMPGGWYRNQFWFIPANHGTALVCLGIHGQMVYVNRSTRIVGVKLSSWPEPQNVGYLVDTLRAFGALGAHLSSRSRPDSDSESESSSAFSR